MAEVLVMVVMVFNLNAYLWWPVAVLGSLAGGAVLAHLFLKHLEKILLVLVGFLLFGLVSRPDAVTEAGRNVYGALVNFLWTVVTLWTSLAR